MNHTTHSLRLPASEHAKFAPARPRDHGHAQPVAEAADVVHARAGERRDVHHHLSGFARA
jgi:hypothetical protein